MNMNPIPFTQASVSSAKVSFLAHKSGGEGRWRNWLGSLKEWWVFLYLKGAVIRTSLKKSTLNLTILDNYWPISNLIPFHLISRRLFCRAIASHFGTLIKDTACQCGEEWVLPPHGRGGECGESSCIQKMGVGSESGQKCCPVFL